MAFMGRKLAADKPAEVPVTTKQLAARYRAQAVEHLERAGKAGRLEAETRHATMGSTAALLAISHQLEMVLEEMRRGQDQSAP